MELELSRKQKVSAGLNKLVGRIHEDLLQAGATPSTNLQLCSSFQDNYILAACRLSQFFYAIEIDYCRAVDTQERFRVQFLLELIHTHPEQMSLLTGVQFDEIVIRRYPIDVRSFDEYYAASRLDHESC